MKNFTYPAVAERCEEVSNLCVYFPDFDGCGTTGENLEDAKIQAAEVLHLHLCGMLEDGNAIPSPTPIEKLKLSPNETAFLVDVEIDADEYNALVTLNLPQSLLALASDSGLNLSDVLVESLKSRLQLQ